MSRASRLRLGLAFLAATFLGTGCWEQWSVSWWPQMKWQKAVHPFEETGHPGTEGGFLPPEGTLPVGAAPKTSDLEPGAAEALANPVPVSLRSLENGKRRYETFCSPCHGLTGLADGPVAGPPWGKGPFLGVLPLAGPIGSQITKNFSDGHIYTVISQGIRRMPSYQRIPAEQRWDIVNYVRYLNGQGLAPATPPAPPAPPAPAVAADASDGGTTQDGGAQQ